MDLTKIHFQVILEGISKLDCYDCHYYADCQKNKAKYCNQIKNWILQKMQSPETLDK
jgi:hypothetical protein